MSSLYIHIPYCKQKCHYCNFYSTANFKNRNNLINSIIREIKYRSNYLIDKKLESIYFGGGTPSILSNGELEKIFIEIRNQFKIDKDCEITFEANPDDISISKLDEIKEFGINRLSIGIQSFDDDILNKLNRVHNSKDAIKSIELAKLKGYNNISIDLIYGIPGLTMDKWISNLEIFRQLNLPHLSSYFLTVEEKTALDVLIRKGKYPKLNEKEGLAHYDYLQEFILKNNYDQYEISNFSRDGKISRHNSNYWKNKPYLGIGPSAHSFNLNSRQWNKSSIIKYIEDVDKLNFDSDVEVLSEKDKFNEFIMLGLRTSFGINLEEVKFRFGKKYFEYLSSYINSSLNSENLLFTNNILKLSSKGKKHADGIASDLFIV